MTTSIQPPLDTLRAAYADPYASAREHREHGGKVVGYFLNSVPEELIVAAGMFPVRLRGDPALRSPRAEQYMEEYMDGEVRSIFGALLDGQFDFVDLIVVPRNSEVYLQLYYFLLEIGRWEPAVRLPPIYLFDLLQTPTTATLRYVTGRLQALGEELHKFGGRAITPQLLSDAIGVTNEKRSLLLRASTLWHSTPHALSGVDALKVISTASFLSHDKFSDCTHSLLASPPTVNAPSPRVLLKGSPQADARITSLIEELGAAVVAHDHLWGDRTYDILVNTHDDPWTALARHYCFDIPSPREYPQHKADERFLALAERARVDGVIFFHDEWDDTLGWEYPDQKKQLDARGIRSLFLKRQRYFDPPVDAQRHEIEAFVAELKS